MARLQQDEDPPGPIVQGFADGGFAIDGKVYRAVLLTPESASAWSPPGSAADLAFDDLAPLVEGERSPEFVLLGTGPKLAFPPRALTRALEARGIGLEAMDSRAASRTWGLLRGEHRWIAAALMPLA